MVDIGIYEDLPFNDYAADGGLNHSSLKIMDDSCEEFFLSREPGSEDGDSDDKAFGRAYHNYILEPKTFAGNFLITHKIVRKGKDWEALKTQSELEKKEILWEEDFEVIKRMKAKLSSHGLVPGLVHKAKRELSVFWKESEDTIVERCKARIDIWNNDLSLVADLKSARSAKPSNFIKDIFNFKYDTQIAWYVRALMAHGIEVKNYVIIAQSKEGPAYSIMVYDLDLSLLQIAMKENEMRLRKFFTCKKAGIWPGYPEVAFKVMPPEWKVKLLENL